MRSVRTPEPALVWKTRLFTALAVLTNVGGNYFLAFGMHKIGEPGSVAEYFAAFLNPWVAIGVALLVTWLLSQMILLSWADLSYVLPVTSIGYVLTALAGRFLLAEQVSPARWLGTLLIMGGVALVSSTPHDTRMAE